MTGGGTTGVWNCDCPGDAPAVSGGATWKNSPWGITGGGETGLTNAVSPGGTLGTDDGGAGWKYGAGAGAALTGGAGKPKTVSPVAITGRTARLVSLNPQDAALGTSGGDAGTTGVLNRVVTCNRTDQVPLIALQRLVSPLLDLFEHLLGRNAPLHAALLAAGDRGAVVAPAAKLTAPRLDGKMPPAVRALLRVEVLRPAVGIEGRDEAVRPPGGMDHRAYSKNMQPASITSAVLASRLRIPRPFAAVAGATNSRPGW